MPFTIETASSADAHEIAALLRRSIVELCTEDHDGDPGRYKAWVANKTADQVEKWIGEPGCFFSARDADGKVLGVAAGTLDGAITLNYVLPEARFSGVSKALMRAVERHFREWGIEEASLESSATARRFYLSLGYEETGTGKRVGGMAFSRLSKSLVAGGA
ncbi:GNAT family N-acetyltransferase [Roseibium sp.]|uniref:GNAT family N-acetyltransferase n=1 Tax=Roseibium sp. TaxID=1936156 RepID=UPI003A970A22